jgi:PAS domain S-box-containing protein
MLKTKMATFLTSSLQRKLMLALMAIATFVIGVGGIYLLSSQQQSVSAGLEARAVYLTNMLSKNLSLPMWDMNMKSIQDQLDMVMSDPEIHSVALYEGEQKQPLAFKKRDGEAVDGIERESPVIYVRDHPQPTVELGRVRVVYTRSYMVQALRQTRMMILAGILLLLVSLSAATYILLRRMVQKPVGELLTMAHRIAEGDLEARIPVMSEDEIGRLGEEFNYMTDKLKQTMDGLSRSEQNYKSINETLEVRIQERTEELRQLLHSAGEGIFGVDPAGQVTFINPAALNMLRFAEEEMLGKGVHGLIHHSREDGSCYPVEQTPMYASYTKGVGNHVTDEMLWRKDGCSFPVEYSSTPITKDGKVMGAVVIFRDITERKQAEMNLAESRATMMALMNSIPDLIYYKNQEGVYLGCNNAFAERVGRPVSEITGKTDYDLFPKEVADVSVGKDAVMLSSLERQSTEEWVDYYDGRKLLLDTLKTPFWDSEGKLLGILGISSDITLRKQEKEILEKSAEALQIKLGEMDNARKAMLNILEDLDAAKKETEATMQKVDAMSKEQVAIFESLTLGIAFVKDRIILRGNTKLGELFGRPLDEMVGQTTRIWYKNEEEYLGIGASTYEDLKRQAIHQREQELPRKDGSLFWCLFRVRAIDAHDITQGIVCTLEDITERKQAEKELKERMDDLERFSRLTINREEKMIQLKEEINALREQAGKEKRYKIVE